jgi:formylglycine-generating enzyme required for sulfatase activity
MLARHAAGMSRPVHPHIAGDPTGRDDAPGADDQRASRESPDGLRARLTEAEAQRDGARRSLSRLAWVAAIEGGVGAALAGWIALGAPVKSVPAPLPPAPVAPPVRAPSGITPQSPACPSGMALIPGGTFRMGSDEREDERPVHAVAVASFCMDLTEVTVAAYAACVSRGACTRPEDGPPRCNGAKADRQDHPINCVDWDQASTYCKAQDGRLPTEEEWEYAARGGSRGRRYPWGDEPPGNQLCWVGESSEQKQGRGAVSCPVGEHPAGDSAQGLHDMAGGVWEWTSSHYCPYQDARCNNEDYVIRGGGWADSRPALVRAASRLTMAGSLVTYDVGVRCAAAAR